MGKRLDRGSETAAGPRPTRRRSMSWPALAARGTQARTPRDAASIAVHGVRQVRLHHRRRRLGRERAGESVVGRSGHARPRHRSRPARLPIRRLHPHARGTDLPDRQPLLRLEVRVGARAVHERPAHLPRARQGARRLVEHQRPDLPARQSARLRAVGGRSRDGDVGLRPLPALLQEDGDLPGGRARRSVARPRRAARPRTWSCHQPVVPGLLRRLPGSGLRAHRRRQRLPPGGVRAVRSQHPRRSAPVGLAGVPEAGPPPEEPDRPDAHAGDRDRVRGPAGHRHRHRTAGRGNGAHRRRRDHPRRRRDQHARNCSS